MQRIRPAILILLTLLLAFGASQPAHAQSEAPIVRAIMYFSPSCGHCHYVMTEVFPPLQAQYGGQLQIVTADLSSPENLSAFYLTLEYFSLENAGVPFLVVGNQYLVGSGDIPDQFPGLIARHLAEGGVDWPPIPGLVETLRLSRSHELPAEPQNTDLVSLVAGRIARDPAGNTASILVLIGMLAIAMFGLGYYRTASPDRDFRIRGWLLPALCLIGLVVAGYLAYVELTMTEAVCGPIGDCNTVQQSEYAKLFGLLSIGVLGLAGYIAILSAWAVQKTTEDRIAVWASAALFGMSVFGLVFSIYLTFLEPFVIGATCAWCLTSAILMTAVFLICLKPGVAALRTLRPSTVRTYRRR